MWGVDLTNSLRCIFRGEGLRDGREQSCICNDFLVANEEGQAIKTGRALRQHHYPTLSEMINELQKKKKKRITRQDWPAHEN